MRCTPAQETCRVVEAAVAARLGKESLEGITVAVQGVGSVGYHLCRFLHEAGASLIVADVNRENLRLTKDELPVTVVPPAEILGYDPPQGGQRRRGGRFAS